MHWLRALEAQAWARKALQQAQEARGLAREQRRADWAEQADGMRREAVECYLAGRVLEWGTRGLLD